MGAFAIGATLGGQIYIRVNDKERVVKVDGILSNRVVFPASMGGSAQFYTSRNFFGDLTGERDFNQFMAAAVEYDPVAVTEIANTLQRQLEKQDIESTGAAVASLGRISRLFIGEGLILGLLSWLIALPLSIPAGYAMTQAMGAALQTEIVYRYTPTGAIYWLAIIVVLSIIASWFPARGAIRISMRESLSGSNFRGVRHAHVPNGAARGRAGSSNLDLLSLAYQ